jgi:hypothetical protein
MGAIRRLLQSILPVSWTAAMEADSRRWVFDCDCGETFSIWDLGGIRYKAAGKPWTWAKCPHCHRGKMRQMRWLDQPVDSNR